MNDATTSDRLPIQITPAVGASANLFWDNTHNRLGIGTSTMASAFEVK